MCTVHHVTAMRGVYCTPRYGCEDCVGYCMDTAGLPVPAPAPARPGTPRRCPLQTAGLCSVRALEPQEPAETRIRSLEKCSKYIFDVERPWQNWSYLLLTHLNMRFLRKK
jgi:hypothetical protein